MIIGIAGSFGSGKGTVVDYLVAEKNFTHYSVRGFLIEEINRRGLPVDRDSMILVANDLRGTHGSTHILELMYARALEQGGDAVIESLRVTAEVKRLQELGGIVIGVDADSKIRYDRAVKRGSETDNVSYEKFIEQEKAESNPNDPTKQDIFGALEESDFIVTNNGSLDELHAQVDEGLKKITK